MSRCWTKSEDAKLLSLRAEGKDLSAISAELNRSVAAINSRLVTTHGFRTRKLYVKKAPYTKTSCKPWLEEENKVILEWLEAGFSFADIAKELNRNEQSVISQHRLLTKGAPSMKSTPETRERLPKVQSGSAYLAEKHKPAGASSKPKADPLAEFFKELISTQNEHGELLIQLSKEVIRIKELLKGPPQNALMLKLNQIMGLLAANHTPLNKLSAGEKLVMMMPSKGEYSTVVKSDRVIIKRVE